LSEPILTLTLAPVDVDGATLADALLLWAAVADAAADGLLVLPPPVEQAPISTSVDIPRASTRGVRMVVFLLIRVPRGTASPAYLTSGSALRPQ
jgi:hypothetical protein